MSGARRLSILLVEDDDVDVMNVERAFKKANIENLLQRAPDGLEALRMLRDGEVSRQRLVILLDLNMPRMGGLEFLAEMRSDPRLKGIPVVVLTTSDAERDRVEAFQLNVAGYILKPVTFQSFTDMMVTLNEYWALMELP